MKVSIVLPTLNELKRTDILRLVKSLSSVPDLELIAVDGGSEDNTVPFLKAHGFQVFSHPSHRRSDRMSYGFEKSSGEVIVFHHPRSYLEPEGLLYLQKIELESFWGGFTHQFDREHWMLRFTSWYSNRIRPQTAQVLYLDHCLIASRDLLQKISGPCFPSVDIFEDTLFSYSLRIHCRPRILNFKSVTSAVRFEKNGFWKQAFLNQILKIYFYLGLDSARMNKLYEKGLFLNSTYDKNKTS
jgi:glycosyltransferase involved in cell wall biosynthesis